MQSLLKQDQCLTNKKVGALPCIAFDVTTALQDIL
jgi:hypothetical protein